jgi:hypothetical protein
MKKTKLYLGFAALFFVICASAPEAFAQREIIQWIRAPLGKLPPIALYNMRYYGKENAEGQNASLGMWEQSAAAALPIINQPDQDLAVATFFSQRHLNTDAILPERDVRLPENLYNLLAGPLYRREFASGWIGGASLLLGSTSDKLFNSEHELTVHADIYARVPAKDENSWLFYVDVDNNRSFLRVYPIVPGAGYWYKPSKDLEMLIGAPAMYLNFAPSANTEIKLMYIVTTDVHAKISYNLTERLKLYGVFDWDNEVFARAGRETRRDKLCYYEKTLSAGLHWQVLKYAGVDLTGGYAFDRFFYEAKDYSHRGTDKVDFKDGPFVQIHVGVPF